MEASCQVNAPSLFDDFYGSMLKQKNKTNYNEFEKCQ